MLKDEGKSRIFFAPLHLCAFLSAILSAVALAKAEALAKAGALNSACFVQRSGPFGAVQPPPNAKKPHQIRLNPTKSDQKEIIGNKVWSGGTAARAGHFYPAPRPDGTDGKPATI